MGHWSDAYVGRAWVPGQFDCADLAQAVRADVFGHAIPLPSERTYLGLVGAARINAMRDQVRSLKDDFARRIEPGEAVEGDAVLLVGRGRPDHIGIVCDIEGARWVLHAAAGPRQVVRTRLRDLGLAGYDIEGFYRWL